MAWAAGRFGLGLGGTALGAYAVGKLGVAGAARAVSGPGAVSTPCLIELPSRPHGNGTPGHWDTILDTVEQMRRSGQYSAIYVNRGIHRAAGVRFSPNRRPDTTGVRHDGLIDLFEVPSKSDSRRRLRLRLDALLAELGERGAIGDIIDIE